MEPHRLGAAAAAGRLPPSAGHLGASHPPSLHSGKFLPPALNLHPNHSDAFPAGTSPFLSAYPGPSPLTSDPAYRPGNFSSLQMAQLLASHAHEACTPVPTCHWATWIPPPCPSTPCMTPTKRTSREGVRDRHYRGERDKDRERSREEQRPHSVVDLTQEARGEEERRARSSDREAAERERDRDAERDVWSFHLRQHQQKSYAQPSAAERRHSPPRPAGRFLGPETDRGGLDEVHHSQNANTISDRHRTSRSESASAATVHFSYAHPPAPQPSAVSLPHPSTPRELAREQRVSAPTYVPSVEVYDERTGPIQIASQARDNRTRDRERDRNREREGHRLAERSLTEHPRLSGDSGNQREEGSIICSNGSISSRGQDTSYSASQSRFSPETRDVPKHSLRLGMERAGAESKWNPISPLANYATSHMAALAAQHGHTLSSPQNQQSHTPMAHSPHTTQWSSSSSHSTHSHSPQTHTSPHGLAAEEGAQRRFLDSSPLYRPGGGERVRGGASDPKEVSAMQSLIKYSGNFAAEGSGSSRHAADNRGAFGGLGSIRSGAEKEKERERERDRDRDRDREKMAAGALRIPPPLKRDPERPDSARSFTREGEGEVRHPPVGIAVAVARQRDSGSSSKQPSGPSDAQRTILQTSIKGLGPSSLHQSLPPGYPPPLSGSVSPAYQFARDPQSGQLIVIPTEHLPHYGNAPAARSSSIGAPRSSGRASHLLPSSTLVQAERLKVTEHRPETEDKADKRNTDPKPHLSSVASTSPLPVMHPHKRRPPSHSPTPSTSSLNPLPPVPSTVTALKSEDSGTRALPHPPTPLAHPASPRSASPPPSSPRQPKQEAAEEGEVGQREQSGARKPASGPFQGMYSALSRILDADVRPQKAECSKLPYLKQETGTGQRRHDVAPESPSPLCRSRSPVLAKQDREDGGRERRGGTPPSLSPHLRLSVALPRGPHGRHMLALLTASEMARARPCSPAPTLPAQGDTCAGPPDCSSTGALEMVALEGMALLSQAAQQSTEPHGPDQDLALKGLDCLLDASRQILLEAIEKQSHIDLPRTLDPSKRYSWRQKKEEPVRRTRASWLPGRKGSLWKM
ncbi:unnamed protein product [Tetraodon nigroviridis]|uniref:(spotted green pufferfish) hypothetical protein n=1 Tax=Tetraodon nigroviridis TaxID=99883 RepID=Q4SSF0_TETNG|nr:unnamed protein product [Tetraodon nigroviridis]